MLEIQDFSAGYPGEPVLNRIRLNFPAGAVTVVAGPNGCGKSTLLKALAGLIPSQGTMTLSGEDLRQLSSKQRARRLAYLPQSRSVPQITVERLVLHGRFPYLSYPRQYSKADRAAAQAAMEALSITHLADRPLESLSGGQRQKAYLAMALAQDTRAVLLDEPTTYLDIAHQMQWMDLARALAAKGKIVIPVLHDLTMALEHADRLVLLGKGIALQGTPEEILSAGAIPEVFGIHIRPVMVDGIQRFVYQR